jgi:iron(III) transport system substrate-binding protein
MLLAALAVWLPGCAGPGGEPTTPADEVVIYTALDQVYSEPILKDFERQTGIRVQPVYDAETAKTTGLVNRLIARRQRPDCDVFWNNEPVQTARLAKMGLLTPYRSPSAERIASEWRDPEGRWTGFAARMRITLYNTALVPADRRPASLSAMADPAWRGRAAIARPFFGTTLTHICWLYGEWGPQRLKAWLIALRTNDVALCPGNAAVRDLVASGERAFGLTDSDDAWTAIQEGKPIAVLNPDDQGGLFLMPNTVALVAGGPHPEAGRKLVDYLLSADVERRLAQGPSAQIPLGTDLAGLKTPWDDLRKGRPVMKVDFARAADNVDAVVALLQETGMDQ